MAFVNSTFTMLRPRGESLSGKSSLVPRPFNTGKSGAVRRKKKNRLRAVLPQDKPVSSKAARNKVAPGQPGNRFYDFSPEDIEAVRIRHCRVDTEELAEEVFKQIVARKSTLADIAKYISTCQASKEGGGDLGWWWKDELVPSDTEQFGVNEQLLGAALRTRPNKLERVKTGDGWHVFIVEEVRHVIKTKHERTPSRQKASKKDYGTSADVPAPVSNTYAMQTLGCQMNRADSERMAGELLRLGYREIDDPFKASLLVLNTCNIRDHAEKKVYSYLGRHTARKRKYPLSVTLAVAGCVAQQEGEKMLRRIPELDLVFGPQYANRLGDLLRDVDTNQCQVAATDPIHIQEDISKPRRESTVTAWVNVMYGCGENCTFCTVGNVVRSVEQSRTMEAIHAEIEDVAKSGIREVVLLGQNIDAYGRDMFPKKTFSELLRFVHDVDGIDRIRFTTSHPRYISRGLVMTCSQLPKVMPYFHIPPQSGNDAVLKAMKRGYSAEAFKKVVERIRECIPDAGICGDMIVGFPGETEEQFQDSLRLMEEVKFDVMNTAAYSPRPNTPAAEFDDQIPEAVKADRLARMNQLVSEHAYERSKRYIGRIEHVLVEHENPKSAIEVVGRNPTNRTVRFRGSAELKGQIVPVKIIEAFPFTLVGEIAGEPY